MYWKISTLFLVGFAVIAQSAILCQNWSKSKRIGELDTDYLDEASGIAVSRQYEDTLYHINDSGDGPYFYVTDSVGGNTELVEISNFTPRDVEDIGIGKCDGGDTCLFIADIGDNRVSRKSVEIILVKEEAVFGDTVSPYKTLRVKYPDGPHNAEGLAVHPNGDIYIVTKEQGRDERSEPAQVFRLSKRQWNSGKKIHTFTLVGEINLPVLLKKSNQGGQIVTGFDIAPSGESMLLLTYNSVVEIAMDLGKTFKNSDLWKKGKDYNVYRTVKLSQQEAISYLPDGSGFIYDTEFGFLVNDAPIYQVDCQD